MYESACGRLLGQVLEPGSDDLSRPVPAAELAGEWRRGLTRLMPLLREGTSRPPGTQAFADRMLITLILAFAVGGEAMFPVILVPPLLLLGVLRWLQWLRWLPAAWAGAILGLGMVAWLIVTLVSPDLLAGGPIALIGLAAFMSELPHLHLPRLHRHGPKPAH